MNAPAISIIAAILLAAAPLRAAEPDPNEAAAAKLLATTVTVRTLSAQSAPSRSAKAALARSGYLSPRRAAEPKSADGKADDPSLPAAGDIVLQGQVVGVVRKADDPSLPASGDGVIVCSGVSVAPGLIVTFGEATRTPGGEAARYKVTLPDGQQALAELRVVDHHSGLNLLEIDHKELPVLEQAAGVPTVGSAVLTAAAAGLERPVVSLGIVSGVDRSLGASGLPPLIQCDLRTTETSSGAAVVDRSSKLIGVIVATAVSDDNQRGGWTYAVPVRHVARLLEAHAADKLVVLKGRRPTIGLTLGAGAKEESVEVERVVPGGPAALAGIKRGDTVLEAEGRKIRSAYQVVELIRNHQPGEKFPIVVEQAGERKTLEITLGGAGDSAADGVGEQVQQNYGGQLRMRYLGNNQLEIQNRAAVGEQNARNETFERRGGAGGSGVGSSDVALLKAQIDTLERVIAGLQAELGSRQELQAKTDEVIKSLRGEVEGLRKELEAKR